MPKRPTPIHDAICQRCGATFQTRYGKYCKRCIHDIFVECGTNSCGRAILNRPKPEPKTVAARCPACGRMHQVPACCAEPGKVPRIYCHSHAYLRDRWGAVGI